MSAGIRRAIPPLVVAAVAILACLLQLSSSKTPDPFADEVQYLNYGRSLAETGRYAATLAGPAADPGPGREPLYPLLIAAVMHLDPVLRDNAGRCIGVERDPTCPAIFRSLRWANALLLAIGAACAFLAARTLGAPPAAAWAGGLYLALNLNLMKDARYVISDFLALALAAGLGLALATACRRPRAVARWAIVGLLLGLLILTKAIYELYALAFLLAAILALVIRRDRAALAALLLVGIVAGGLVGGWVARNYAVFHRPSLTDARGGMGLSTREVFDHMTAGEYAASFLWWTRGPGPGLARRLLPERDWHRHEWYAADGFYLQGQNVRYEARVERLMKEDGLDRAHAEAAVPGVIVGEILSDLPMYLATMPPLFYRGLWFDEFIVFGFPALVWLVIRAFRRRDGAWLAALSPALFSLLAYPALTLNIARYQLTAAPGIALAAGVALAAILARVRAKRTQRAGEAN